jgi:hypothetical protein
LFSTKKIDVPKGFLPCGITNLLPHVEWGKYIITLT